MLLLLLAHVALADEQPSAGQAAPGGNWSLAAGGNMSYVFPKGPYAGALLHSYGASFFDLRAKWQAAEGTADPYERALHRPTVQVGLAYGDFSHVHLHSGNTPYESGIGRLWALYTGLQYDVVRHGRWGIGLDLQNGIGYCPRPYDETDNRDNHLIGAPFSIYVGLGLYARYRLSPRWQALFNADFRHFSNGTLSRPNLGVNAVGPTLSVEYDLKPADRQPKPRAATADAPYPAGFYLETTAMMGLKTLIDHFNAYQSGHSPLYASPTVMVAPMLRYHRLHASGLEIDYTYADYVYRLRNFDQMFRRPQTTYSPHVVGIGFRHEVFYHHVSLAVGAGIYLKKQLGYTSEHEDGRYFQNVGLRYSLPFTGDRLFVGYNVRAHRFSKADCLQIALGWRLAP